MKRTLIGLVVLCGIFSIGLAVIATGNSAVDGEPWGMMASPSVVVLDKVDTLTVHTNIPAELVVDGSVLLDGVAPSSVGVDSCGDIVAKFAVSDLGLELGEVALTLRGVLEGGLGFTATDVVRVK